MTTTAPVSRDSSERHGCPTCGRDLELMTEEFRTVEPDQWWVCPVDHPQPRQFNGRKTRPLLPDLV